MDNQKSKRFRPTGIELVGSQRVTKLKPLTDEEILEKYGEWKNYWFKLSEFAKEFYPFPK